MRIREYTPGDLDALRRMHTAQSFGYPFPDLESPLFIAKLVLEEDSRTGFSLSHFAESFRRSHPDGLKPVLLEGPLADDRKEEGRDTQPRCNSPRDSNACGDSADAQGREEADRDSLLAGSPPTQRSRVTMAVLLRLTAESYLLHDPRAGTPRQRWQHILALHEAARRTAIACGLDDVQAFLPPRVARAFGRRLARLGWARDPWPCFSRQLP